MLNILTITLILLYPILLLLEHVFPLRQPCCRLLPRLLTNLAMTLLVLLTAGFLIKPESEFLIAWTSHNQFGLLHWIHAGKLIHFVLGFLLLDLSFYYWHQLNHRVNLLWRFHNVHHIDPDLDVTTSARFHFIEIVYSTVFRLLQLLLIGVTPFTFIAYEFIFQANTLFHHSNIRLPKKIEQKLNAFWVTPRMHGIHHSQVEQQTHSNFSVIFSIWDYLHCTINLKIPQKTIKIGVPAYTKKNDNKLISLLIIPFKKQRKYWKK